MRQVFAGLGGTDWEEIAPALGSLGVKLIGPTPEHAIRNDLQLHRLPLAEFVTLAVIAPPPERQKIKPRQPHRP